MPLRSEPVLAHDTPARVGVLLVNLGTPDAPTTTAVRRYLAEFLWDRRVVEIPRPIWWAILHGIILRTRPAKSAAKYACIWQPEGSPLRLHTARQTDALRDNLSRAIRTPLSVAYAMRYGNPSIAATLDEFKRANVTRLLVVPLYPQYASSSTGSVIEAVMHYYADSRNIPELRFVRGFATHLAYVDALADQLRERWQAGGRPDKLVMSFHGVPKFSLGRGDPYHCECHATARLLAERLGLAPDAWQLSFQSRFGRTEWLKPYTSEVLADLGRSGPNRVEVITPGFVGDCLETLEEIAIEGRDLFIGAGGKNFYVHPCLNERPAWLRALTTIASEHLHSWASDEWDDVTNQGILDTRKARAVALGAKQ